MKFLIKTIAVFFCISINVNAQLKLPALSAKASSTQKVGLTEVSISYARPNVRGREIFGDKGLVPYGKFWRTGANAATKISFDTKVIIEGTELDKGAYAILTKPGKTNWEIFFYPYKESNWSKYATKDPIVKATGKVFSSKDKIESFEIKIQNITFDGADIVFAWDKTRVEMPFVLKTKEQAIKNIDKVVNGPSDFDYFQAALYLHESKSDLEKALVYIQKVTKKEKAMFFQVYREAVILKDLNKKKEALASAKRSLALSEKAKNDDFVRLNKNLIKELTK